MRFHLNERRAWSIAVFLVALVGSFWVFRAMWHGPSRLIPGGPNNVGDPMQMMWNLKWTPWALTHGHNPFHTVAVYYPAGVSLSWNTLVPVLGLVAAPVTFTAGPGWSFAILLTLAPALTALTGYWWLRRHVTHHVAAAVGGLAIAFSPYMSGHFVGQLNLMFVPVIPLMLMFGEDLLWRRPRPQWRSAVYLGIAAAVQAGISEEIILITAIGAVLALLFALAFLRGAAIQAYRSALPGFGIAIGCFALLASPLLIEQLFLSPHLSLRSGAWRARFVDYTHTLGRQLIAEPGSYHSFLGGAEDGVYLGWLMLVVLAAGIALTWRRDVVTRIAVPSLIVVVLLTLGWVHGDGPLPWGLFAHISLFQSILPGRMSFASWLIIACLLARWLDALLVPGGSNTQRGARAAGVVAIVAALITVAPASMRATPAPPKVAFFTSTTIRQLIPDGSAVYLLPSANPFDVTGMYYQQQSDFRFVMPGGYDLRPKGRAVSYGPPSSPLILLAAYAHGRNPSYPAGLLAQGRVQLVEQGYRAIVVVMAAPRWSQLAVLAEDLTGRAADRAQDGVLVWLLGPQ